MLIPPELLVDGCVRTLLEAVLPDVSSRFARGQLYAVVDVLRNLRDRVEQKASLAATETASARAALGRAAEALPATGPGAALADTFARALADTAALAPCDALESLRAVLREANETLHTWPDAEAAPARAALGAHLAAQAVRDVMLLKPSLLREISKG